MREGEKRAGVADATPRPWKLYHLFVYRGGEDGANIAACGDPWGSDEVGYTQPKLGSEGLYVAAANAELIVRAVNAHDDLVGAAEKVMAYASPDSKWADDLERALAKAKGPAQ